MEKTTEESKGLPTGGPLLCSKCKGNVRSQNSSWCRDCRNEQAAEYRARQRPKKWTEDRVCALEECDEIFTWRSERPLQRFCSKSHYGKGRWREKHPKEEWPDGQILCSKCGRWQSKMLFSPSRRDLQRSWCRECSAVYEHDWRTRNVEKRSAASRRSKRARLLRLYKAPSDDFDSLLEQQGGGCAICGGPKGQREYHIDHSHETLQYRGILCSGCNLGLGHFGEDVRRLQAAVDYLGRFAEVQDRKSTGFKEGEHGK